MDSAYWLVTKEEVGEALKIDASAHDAWLVIVIDGVSEWLETQCNRQFKKRTFEEEVIGDNDKFVLLEQRPVISITSFVDGDGNSYTETADDFKVGKKSGILKLLFALSKNIVYTITYEAGFETIPGDLKMAAIELIGKLHQMREQKTWNTRARSTQAGNITYEAKDISPTVQKVITKYQTRRVA